MSGFGRVARIGCLTVLAVVVSPVVLLLGFVGFGALRDATCVQAETVRVRLQDTDYAVPARLQPTFSPRFNGTRKGAEIRTVRRGGRYAYCPGLGRRFVLQAGFMIEQKALADWTAASSDALPQIERVRIFGLSERAPGPLGPLGSDEFQGPPVFGRPTRYHCFTGYYGPGETCIVYGQTADGALIRANLYPRGSQAQMFAAMGSVEQVIAGLRAPAGMP